MMPPPPIVFGIRQGSVLKPGERVVVTCSSEGEQDDLVWEVEGDVRGEGAEVLRRGGKVISSWEYQAKLADSSIVCKVKGQIERSAALSVIVKKEQEVVTLQKYSMDDYSEKKTSKKEHAMGKFIASAGEDAVTDTDPIETMKAAAKMDMQTFSDSNKIESIPPVAMEETKSIEVNEAFSSFQHSESTVVLPRSILILTVILRHLL